MSLQKAIDHGKEHRKGYAERGLPGRFDMTCRPHGAGRSPCPYCERNRLLYRRKMTDLVAINAADVASIR